MSAEQAFAEAAASSPRCFWLDGGGAREWSGRRSVLGRLGDDDVSLTYSAARREVVEHTRVAGAWRARVVGDDIFTVLADRLRTESPDAHWVGLLGYAANPDLPARPDPDLPDAVWLRATDVRVVGETPSLTAGPAAAAADDDGTALEVPDDYAAGFAAVQEALHAGDSYEVNLTARESLHSDRDPAALYLRLRAANPAPYAGFLQHDVPGHRAWLLSSSPERYALIRPGETPGSRVLETRPIKGTTPRGATGAEDAVQRERLAGEAKYRAENLMITDLLRHDLAGVCEVGTVQVPDLMRVESYPAVHQLVTTVTGVLRPEVETVAALRALFPAGSMTGAPKRRTMEVIDAVEATPRGAYAGAFGWLGPEGRADLGVVIRSASSADGRTWRWGTGGGITVHSDLAEEYAETRWKCARLRAALGAEG